MLFVARGDAAEMFDRVEESEETLIPTTATIAPAVQCVASPGGSVVVVRATTRSATSGLSAHIAFHLIAISARGCHVAI